MRGIGKFSLKDKAHWVCSLTDLQIYNQNRHTSRLDSLLSVVASAVVVRGSHSVGSTCNHLCTHHQSVQTAIKQICSNSTSYQLLGVSPMVDMYFTNSKYMEMHFIDLIGNP